MDIDVKSILSGIEDIYDKYYAIPVNEKLDKFAESVKKIEELVDAYCDKVNTAGDEKVFYHVRDIKLFHTHIFNYIKTIFEQPIKLNYEKQFYELNYYLGKFIGGLDDQVKLEQLENRFKILKSDKLKIKLIKPFKNFLYMITGIPRNTGNLIRKIFRKELKPQKKWHHKVPLGNFTAFYMRDRLGFDLNPLLKESYRLIGSLALKLRKTTEIFDKNFSDSFGEEDFGKKYCGRLDKKLIDDTFSEIFQGIEEYRNKLNSSVNNTITDKQKIFEVLLRKCGTIELSSKKYSNDKVQKANEELNSEYENLNIKWSNNNYIIFDTWRFYEELTILRYSLSEVYYTMINTFDNKINGILTEKTKQIESYIEQLKTRLENFKGSDNELITLLNFEKNELKNTVSNDLIKNTIELILDQNFPFLVDEIETTLRFLINSLDNDRALIKSGQHETGIKESEIDKFSPHELISFDLLPRFTTGAQKLKNEIIKEFENIQQSLTNLDEIALYNIEAGIAVFDDAGKSHEDALVVSVEGMERALSKIREINQSLKTVFEFIRDDLFSSVNEFSDKLLSLTSSEKVSQIKLTIAKAKALEKSKEIREDVLEYIKHLLPSIQKFLKKYISRTIGVYGYLSKKVGIAPLPTEISAEISNFLAETKSSIDKLPFAYQRLFRIAPLDNDRFFTRRDEELGIIKKAYENWDTGRFANLVLIGEKGSGITSLLNIFLDNNDIHYEVIRTEVRVQIYNKTGLINFFREMFDEQSFTEPGDIVYFLNRNVIRRVVIIENIQQMFLRKVDGFENIKILADLIAKTGKNVLWILSCSLYSWDYLENTVIMSDYFSYIVKIRDLKDTQITDLILKRHSVSGYRIVYLPPQKTDKNQKLGKMPEDERQEHLKKEFFSDLNKIAKSNISLALLYWLRSAVNSTINSISIASLKDLDFTFMKILQPVKVFTIHSLILHDGLNLQDFAEAMSIKIADANLLMMSMIDDGLILKENDHYFVNPMLYRQSVNLLKSKNLI